MGNRPDFTKQRNEVGGNRTAAREYNQPQQRFLKSRRIDETASEAAHDLSKEAIRRELAHAETVGRRHPVGDEPDLGPSYKK
jgi:hypothetical protein